ncbi:DUF6046 domain-containing protein [Flavobacterium sp.]|uniref:DUF6046 domain-containing protein n=1 Tax=Flavobacterium sp. TaxID=239 RepID=UPI0026288196|nr:DUF6046 domain-containing protein [Flavobacterium sp.]
MADSRYNLSQLFKSAFGINSPIFITQPLSKEQKETFDYRGIEMITDYHKSEATSWMGTPIIGLLKFKGGTYKRYNSRGVLEDRQMLDFTLPPATLFSFRRAKNITKTNLLGSNGTVKEIFGFDDWIIEAKGLAIDTPEMSATDQIKILEEWENLASSIEIKGGLFTNKNINAITIDDYREESVQGSPGIIPFSMTLSSDESIVLILPDVND